MVSSDSENRLSPLDQIRHAEAEVARRIAAARETAERTVATAKAQAKDFLNEACETGQREGQARYKEIISRAEEETQALVAQAYYQADELRYQGDRNMEPAVFQALNVIIRMEVEDKSDES